mmetsp:Transcript_31937/g.46658  ORF Transcript_31937/g.46658 Transcript_31937/m.46658 type:complete len:154 (+) Transcript_31937:1-462(+)
MMAKMRPILVVLLLGYATAVPLQHSDNSLPILAELIAGVTAGDTLYHGENGTHYEDPYQTKCSSEEVNITIVGTAGAMCSPVCGLMDSCPQDVPDDVTAKAKCALQDMAGRKFCALLCSMTLPLKDQKLADAQCGPQASCKPISSVGICTYDE